MPDPHSAPTSHMRRVHAYFMKILRDSVSRWGEKGVWGHLDSFDFSVWENRDYNPKMHGEATPKYNVHINKSPIYADTITGGIWPSYTPSIMRDLSDGTFGPSTKLRAPMKPRWRSNRRRALLESRQV